MIGQTAEAIRLAGGADFAWELYHVLGSSSNLDEMLRKVPVPPECAYHQVQLGFVVEGSRSRWLTHDEISNGVIDASGTTGAAMWSAHWSRGKSGPDIEDDD